jgi:hypothetical protein
MLRVIMFGVVDDLAALKRVLQGVHACAVTVLLRLFETLSGTGHGRSGANQASPHMWVK